MNPSFGKRNLVLSCHADTGFSSHRLKDEQGRYIGHLDNLVGVHAVMNAFFSGRLDHPGIRIELTYGEETDMEGAYDVLRTLTPADVVVVVDVTGTKTDCDITIEKCASSAMQSFVRSALHGLSYELHEDCPDPIADEDECDVYARKLPYVFFLGIPCQGGDYNFQEVSCRKESVLAATAAIIRFVETFQKWLPDHG